MPFRICDKCETASVLFDIDKPICKLSVLVNMLCTRDVYAILNPCEHPNLDVFAEESRYDFVCFLKKIIGRVILRDLSRVFMQATKTQTNLRVFAGHTHRKF